VPDTAARGPFDPVDPPEPPTRLDAAHPAPPGDRPNLVLISIDTLRADRLGAYGHDRPTSPTIDRFAAGAVLFENALAQAPVTAPSHATLFTGLYPEAHRVQNMFDGEQHTGVPPLGASIPTLAEILSAAGYATSARVGGGNVHPEIGFGRGFDSYVVLQGWRATQQFEAASVELARLAEGGEPFLLFAHTYETHAPYLPPAAYRAQFTDPDYAGRIVGDAAELDRVAEGGYIGRHAAFFARVDPDSFADRRHLRDLYDATIRAADDAVAVLLDAVDAQGLADRTLVVLLSDHGEQFGEHGAFEHDDLWNELLHVPLVIRVPEGVRAGWSGRRVAETVGLVDVLPTLLDLLGLPTPEHVQGRSLVGRVEGTDASPGWAFAQYRARSGAALVADDWKWLQRGGQDPPMLFALAVDPDEFIDRAAEHRDWERGGAVKIRQLLNVSRGFWPLVGETGTVAPSEATRRALEALGYLDAPAAPAEP